MKPHILLVDDQQSILYFLRKTLEGEGYDVSVAETGAGAMERLTERLPDVVLLDMRLPDRNGLDILRELRERYPRMAVVMMTAFGDVQSSVAAMKLGAFDYVNKPIGLDELLELLEAALQRQLVDATSGVFPDATPRPASEEGKTGEPAPAPVTIRSIPYAVGGPERGGGGEPSRAESMREVYARLRKLAADAQLPVLIIGEAGSGRAHLARVLHANSNRADRPFRRIRCGAHTPERIEEELFSNHGIAAAAVGGSLLLEGIDELHPRLQLRVLDLLDRTGDDGRNLRLLCSSHSDLGAAAERGDFRPELYVRLHPGRVAVPPLRRRRADIIPLAGEFLREAALRRGIAVPELSAEAEQLLLEHAWPGNLAELRRQMAAACALCDAVIRPEDLDLHSDVDRLGCDMVRTIQAAIESVIPPEGIPFEAILENLERSLIEKAYRVSDGNQSQTAKLLNLNRDKLRYRMKNFELI
jgi:DNA-binding NtrC family response regulator